MSLTKNQFHEEINQVDDEIFEVLSQEEWEANVQEQLEKYINEFGNGTYSRLLLSNYLKKNS